ncbi:54S ribosomal protein L22, mitochondrial [Neolecta irregularis DAH-3]|uniref:54S ribosomal protein L22, mitochondrial n=1 Tax=Neolecta irregularis (strain DAH-3) TaxID=1198029 RepID=A0A1U7LIL1_NEOID|nr:54S ribosomal protein L22, mitochondrial [Neolecta irregularis DAH-3]|eukprot:OLL22433.1 54S ribosomal protein L22, mitochondrial [Neolecta irregularis DAH-3]
MAAARRVGSLRLTCPTRLAMCGHLRPSDAQLALIAPFKPILSCADFHTARVNPSAATESSIFDWEDAQVPLPKTRVKKSRKYRLANEKTVTHKSVFLRTSVKKLGNLARQIAGQNLNQAITQMEFSHKRVANDIAIILKQARSAGITQNDLTTTEMFIDQAWVGRGSFLKNKWPVGRGQANLRRSPTTKINVILKGDDTLRRRAKEAEEKRLRRKLWVPLPSRPIHMRTDFSC